MPKPLLARIHAVAAAAAIAVIMAFLVSSGVIELTGGAGDIRVLRHAVLLGLPLRLACLVTAGLTGQRLAGGSRPAVVRRKQRRLQAAAAAGLLVLVPCALILSHLAGAPSAAARSPPWRSPNSPSAPSTCHCSH
ncbi:MAG: hypothetical protein ACLQDY_30750 [Streptosporangiaceae bacterium]